MAANDSRSDADKWYGDANASVKAADRFVNDANGSRGDANASVKAANRSIRDAKPSEIGEIEPFVNLVKVLNLDKVSQAETGTNVSGEYRG